MMSYFLAQIHLAIGNNHKLIGDEARHIILSRRIRIGEKIKIQDGRGKRFMTEVTDIGRNDLSIHVLEEIPVPMEPELKITIYQALIKEKQLDYVLQKCTELGAFAIGLFNADNTPIRMDGNVDSKLARWRKICQEAAKQSERGQSPELQLLPGLAEIIENSVDLDVLLVLDMQGEHGPADLASKLSGVENIGIVIGPEGGLTESELVLCEKPSNIHFINLGPRVLRAETAASSALAIAQALFGDMRKAMAS